MQTNYITEFLNLKGVEAKKISHGDNFIKVFLETNVSEQKCPCCGKRTSKVHDYRTQVIKDCFYNDKLILLSLKKRRYACACGKRFLEKYDFLPKYYRMTTRLISHILMHARSLQSMTQIAKLTGVSVNTVMRILDFVNFPVPSLPKVLSIDEFRGNAGGEKFQCILVDAKNREVLDVLPSRKQYKLIDYFRSIPRHERHSVQYFISDMYAPYIDLARTFFPNAKIIIDKYHFIRQVNWAFENVRKQIQKTMLPSVRKYYKHSRKLLLKQYNTLSEEDQQAVDLMLLYHDDLRLAYRLKEKFQQFCNEKKYSLQRELFHDWILYAEESGVSHFKKCAKTFRRFRKEILNAFKYGYTNGATEGFNNKIKVLKRVSYGVKNFKRFRNRILLTTTKGWD